jgi:hypothetical protein
MKRNMSITALLVASTLAGVTPLAAQEAPAAPTATGVVGVAPGKAAAAASVDVSATVTAIDAAKREVTLKRADGTLTTVAVGDQVRNFNQIKVGDTVHASYTRAVALELKKGAVDKGAPTVEQQTTRAPAGASPAGVVSQKVTAMADVTAVDPKNHTVTVRGPEGNEVDLEVSDPDQLKNIKKGDHVQVTYLEALAVSVKPTHVAAAK